MDGGYASGRYRASRRQRTVIVHVKSQNAGVCTVLCVMYSDVMECLFLVIDDAGRSERGVIAKGLQIRRYED